MILSVSVFEQVKFVCDFVLQNQNGTEQLEPWLLKEMDSCISNIFVNEDQDTFIQLFNLIIYESVSGMTIHVHALVFFSDYIQLSSNSEFCIEDSAH